MNSAQELLPHEIAARYREREEANARRKHEKQLAEQQLVEARHQKFLAETALAVTTATTPTAPAKPVRPNGFTDRRLAKRLTPFMVKVLGLALRPIIKDFRDRLAAAERENLALQHRLAAAENTLADRSEIRKIQAKFVEIEDALSSAMSFQGVWEPDRVYRRGACVSHSGSLWFALTESVDLRPGSGSKAWRMTMKSGAWHDG